ncbi:MAG: septum formation initiator family protein [Bacteroidales bacterium]|jgi:cell division protein FtsB|nr:septum formation initiator family protein [Bacteroidales bacterium]
MEEKKDRWAWLKRSDHNYLVPFVIVSTTLVALWLLFFAHNSVISWIGATVEERNQQKEMARLQREIEEMDREIQNLRNNPDTLETFARETYHFAAPGDDVYIVE